MRPLVRAVLPWGVLGLLAAALVLLLHHGGEPEDARARAMPLRGDDPAGAARVGAEPAAAKAERRALTGGEETAAASMQGFVRALASFTGRVLEPDGSPAADADVLVSSLDASAWSGEADGAASGPAVVRARTDAAGRFRIEGLWPRVSYLLCARKGASRSATAPVRRAPEVGEDVDVGDVLLRAGTCTVGTVVDARGLPLRGARVRAVALPQRLLHAWAVEVLDADLPLLHVAGDRRQVVEVPQWLRASVADLGVLETRTDANGRFRLDGVASQDATLLVHARGHVPLLHPVGASTTGGEVDVGTLVLEGGVTVHGTVCEADGAPVPGAEILIGQGTALVPWVCPVQAAPTDTAGRFRQSGFRRGEVVVAARRGADAPWTVVEARSTDEALRIALSASCTLRLTVRDAAGRAVEPAIELVPAVPGGANAALATLGFEPAWQVQRAARAAGDGTSVLSGLPSGEYLLRVAATGCGPYEQTIRLQGDLELLVELPAPSPCRVLVIDADDGAVPDAVVTARSLDPRSRTWRPPQACGRTGTDGSLDVVHLGAGRTLLRAVHPAFGSVEQEVELPAPAAVPLRFVATGTIEGAVARERPPGGGAWSIAITAIEARPGEQPPLPRLAEADDDGRFVVAGLQPGAYDVCAAAAPPAMGLDVLLDASALPSRFAGRDHRARAIVLAGRTTKITLEAQGAGDGEGVRVAGTVLVNGRPAPGLEVRGWHQRWLVGAVGPDGTFDLGFVAPGQVGLYVVDPALVRQGGWEVLWWREVTVEGTRGMVSVDVSIALGALAGSVVRADGVPVAGCSVKVTGRAAHLGKDEHAKFYGVTDRDGRFAFAGVPAGLYEVAVWNPRFGRGSVGAVNVTEGGATEDVVVELVRVVDVRGRVALENFAPQVPQWTWLRLYGKDDEGRYLSSERGCSVRDDGTFLLEGVPPGRYEVSIGAMFPGEGSRAQWQTHMFVHDEPLLVPNEDVEGLVLRPIPRARKSATR